MLLLCNGFNGALLPVTVTVIVQFMELPKDLGPKMQACSERERLFVWAFLGQGCQDASEAARKAGCSDPGPQSSAIRVRGHELRHRQRVIEAMQEVARLYFGGLLLPAVLAAEDMIGNPKHPDHAKMVQAVLGAQGLGERRGLDVNFSGEVTVNHTDAALDDLRRLQEFGVPRAKLIETFGFSGLERYEKMLAQRDGRLIEHRAEEKRE
jgi:hypothetical protein